MLAFLKIHNFVGPSSLYLGKEYFKEILSLKKTFIEKPVKFSFCKSTCYYRRSPHWPSRVRLDNDYFKRYFHAMLSNGVYLPPSAYESYFLNDAISYEDLDHTLDALSGALSFIERK